MSYGELEEFVGLCRRGGITCALAGSIRTDHLQDLARLNPDLIGVRGALCTDLTNRESAIDGGRTREFIELTNRAVKEVQAAA